MGRGKLWQGGAVGNEMEKSQTGDGSWEEERERERKQPGKERIMGVEEEMQKRRE